MKIMFVTPYYMPSIGGVQQYVSSLAQALKNRHEVVVVTTQQNPQEPRIEQVDGVTIHRLPVLFRISNTPYHPAWKWHFKALYRKEQPDIINAHAPVPWFADVAERANKARIPFVLTYHSGSMKKGSTTVDLLIGLYENYTLKKTLLSSSRIIGIYPDFLRTLIRAQRHIEQVVPGIDTDFFTPKSRDTKHYDLILAARLEKTSSWKGVDVALNAVALLAKSNKQISLCIAGDGDARQHHEALSEKLGISKQVHFVGSLSKDKLRDAYRSSRIVLLPSLSEAESFGMVVAEAASCGIPAIGSKIGGIPYVIEANKTGLLVQPGDPVELAEAIGKLLNDRPLRQQLGKAARQRAKDYFSTERLITATSTVFETAIHSPAPKNLQITAFYPPALGGMERVAENIAIELAEAGQSVEVVSSSIGSMRNFQDYDRAGYVVSRLKAINVGGLPVIPSLLWHLLRQPKGSIYHMHVAQAFLPECALIAAWIRRGTFIAHFHLDVAPSGRFGFIFTLYKKLLFPIMLRSAHRVIVFSEDQKQLIQNKYGVSERSIRILPNGIRRGFERTKPRALHTPPRLLFVGRLSSQKNVGFLLDSLDGISDTVVTRIVGDGELRPQLEHHAAKLNLQNLTFTGRKDDDELLDEYAQADIFILPSEREGMPLVLIDAMAMRLPAIGSRVLGIRDLISDSETGLLVPLDDTKALRNAITSLSSSPEVYAAMSTASYAAVRELAWPQLIQRLLKEVYK